MIIYKRVSNIGELKLIIHLQQQNFADRIFDLKQFYF